MRRKKKKPIPEEVTEMEEDIDRARELADEERMLALQEQAADMTTDFNSAYGRRGFSMFGGMS